MNTHLLKHHPLCRFISFLTVLIVLSSRTPADAQQFSISPDDDGSLNVYASFDWGYENGLGGKARLWTANSAAIDDDTPGAGLEQSIAMVQRQLSGEFVPMLYRTPFITAGLSISSDRLNVKETGFVDFVDPTALDDAIIRLYFSNLRTITTLKPGISASIRRVTPGSRVELSGSYAPWMLLVFEQDFASLSEDARFTTERIIHGFRGSSWHAWSATASARVRAGQVAFDAESSWEGTLYDYEFVGIGGAVFSQSSWIVNGRTDLLVSFDRVALNAWIPCVGVGYVWSGMYDEDPSGIAEGSGKVRFAFGFRGEY